MNTNGIYNENRIVSLNIKHVYYVLKVDIFEV